MNVTLRTAQGSHPLRRGNLPEYRPVPRHPAHAFAAALAERYRRHAGAWLPLGAIFAHPQTGTASPAGAIVQHHVHTYGPRLKLTLASRWQMLLPGRNASRLPGLAAERSSLPARGGTHPVPAGGDVLHLVLNRPPGPSATIHLESRIIREITARARRVSLLDVPAEQAATAATTAVVDRTPRTDNPAAAPVRRVIRRSSPEKSVTEAARRARDEREAERNRPVQPQKPVQLDPAEINRVTEHVLRTIDRQMWARRERTGRV